MDKQRRIIISEVRKTVKELKYDMFCYFDDSKTKDYILVIDYKKYAKHVLNIDNPDDIKHHIDEIDYGTVECIRNIIKNTKMPDGFSLVDSYDGWNNQSIMYMMSEKVYKELINEYKSNTKTIKESLFESIYSQL